MHEHVGVTMNVLVHLYPGISGVVMGTMSCCLVGLIRQLDSLEPFNGQVQPRPLIDRMAKLSGWSYSISK